jgi:hypothetical protein
MKLTPSQVKNNMRRGLRLLVDPEPDRAERERCIAFFGGCCAYCGTKIVDGQGTLDHLLAASRGGRNHISNRVFSCRQCNDKEKRERPWKEFLTEKTGREKMMQSRLDKISEWINFTGAVPPLSEATLRTIEQEGQRATAVYEQACKRVREA